MEEGKELADHYNIRSQFLETSAKESTNVEEAFTLMTKEIKSRVVTVVNKPQTAGRRLQPGAAGKRAVGKKEKG